MAKKFICEQFDNLDAFARGLERPENSVFRGRECSSKGTDRSSWYGTPSYEAAMKLFRDGWTEKADEIRKEFLKFERANQQEVTYEKTRPATSVIGFTPHVPNAILGLPNSMIYTERTPMKAKVVRLIFNMGMNAGTNAKDIMNAGLVALKIVHSLEKRGLRVRLDVTPKFSQGDRENVCAVVCIKEWRQPLDIKKIAFPTSHPSMFRRLGFRWMETMPEITDNRFYSGYGQSFEDVEKEKALLKEAGVLRDQDYYMNVKLASDNDFDLERVAKAIGIKNL